MRHVAVVQVHERLQHLQRNVLASVVPHEMLFRRAGQRGKQVSALAQLHHQHQARALWWVRITRE